MSTATAPVSGRLLTDEGNVAAVVIDEAGRVTETTAAANALLGRGASELVGCDLDGLVVSGWNWVVRNSLLRLASGSFDAFELLLRGRSGRRSLVRMIPQRWAMPTHADGAKQFMLLWIEQRRKLHAAESVSESEAELRRQAYSLMKTHEAERGRIASDLHDGVAPLVVIAKFMIEHAMQRMARGESPEATELLSSTVARLREVLAEIRRISTELRPSSLDDLGLLPTIQWHCRIVSQAYPSLRVKNELTVDESLIPDELKLDIFRIVQEALSNVVRHAGASDAFVTLREARGRIELRVEDNGAGFDMQRVLHNDTGALHVGLQSIRKRVDATRGTLELVAAPGWGTRVVARWPFAADRAAA